MMYTQDYDETLPGNSYNQPGLNWAEGFVRVYDAADPKTARIWARDVQPYLKNYDVFTCPQAAATATTAVGYTPVPPPGQNMTYFLNGIAASRPLSDIQAPSDTIYLQEANVLGRAAQERPTLYTDASGAVVNQTTWWRFNAASYDTLHQGGANLLFCGGHAKWQNKNSITLGQFGAKTAATLLNADNGSQQWQSSF